MFSFLLKILVIIVLLIVEIWCIIGGIGYLIHLIKNRRISSLKNWITWLITVIVAVAIFIILPLIW